MRSLPVLFATSMLSTSILSVPMGGALAQNAPSQQTSPGSAGAEPAMVAEQPVPAPGAESDGGKAMPSENANGGTTTTFAPPKSTAQVKWPCAQPRVPKISAGTIWSGPDLDAGKGWDEDDSVAALAQKIASRRLSLEDADARIDDFAKSAGADKDKKLTELFVGVLDIINENRENLLQGIMRYASGQQRLAERMRTESDTISEGQDEVQGPTGVAATERNKDFAWDQRIFQERRQALSYVCETPTLLERRAFELGKRIQARL